MLSEKELKILKWLLAETFEAWRLSTKTSLPEAIEIGPRLGVATPFNSNALSILNSCGFGEKITRLEVSRRIVGAKVPFDRMRECIYPEPIKTFSTGQEPAEVYEVQLIEKGLAAFNEIEGLSMDEYDKQLYYDYFVVELKRNPTIVEIIDLMNANSEHCRHGYWKGKQVIDGVEMPETLMDIVQSTLKANPSNSLVAFRDNSSVIIGYDIWTLIPDKPGQASEFTEQLVEYHFLFTAETHNFPTFVSPFPGAQTGTGGRIRDDEATGCGGLVVAGTTGYAVGNLNLPGYFLPWEKPSVYPSNLAYAQDIIIFGSDGTSRYGNEFGEPVIQGFTRSGAYYLPNGIRYEWLKPILFTGGVGQIDARHLEKQNAEKGMLIIQIGGPACRVGFGGGAASSKMQGENKESVDFNAVQRGDPEVEKNMDRVIRACIEMGDFNPIVSIHDQGAGGPANVLKELVEKAGGKIYIRKINSSDPTMSVLELWVCEYQERMGLLIRPEHLELFQAICDREGVNCEVLGEVTGDGIFTVVDSKDNTTPVQMELQKVLGNLPQKTFTSETIPLGLKPLNLPKELTVFEALNRVLRLLSVGSKRFLVNKKDRSVTGLVKQQQCCGYPQLAVADVAVISQSHFSNNHGLYSGAAISIGEQPGKMLVNEMAGARMAVIEALTNIASARISNIKDVKCSANWMGAPKLPGEGARMYRAAASMRDLMIKLGIAVDGGKDSLSMATKVKHPNGETELVKSPMELVISAYCSMPDITKVVNPDIKRPGESKILHIDLAGGKCRLGGSALAQVYEQLGNKCPDMNDDVLFLDAFNLIQNFVERDLALSLHDISDGGLIVSLLEMLFSGDSGFRGTINCGTNSYLSKMFAEEAGWLMEYLPENEEGIVALLNFYEVPYQIIGNTIVDRQVTIFGRKNNQSKKVILDKDMIDLRQIWESTSYELEKLQCNPKCVEEEKLNIKNIHQPPYRLSFVPELTSLAILTMNSEDKPKVAIIRTKGSNGDREMNSYFELAGFKVTDIHMHDLLNGKVNLLKFRGVVFVGGFANADVFDAAKGWAAIILFNEKVQQMFDDFYARPDTFSLSVCNGCQLAALLGWIPVKGTPDIRKARFIKNKSGRFESRFPTVTILPSNAMMLKGMAGSTLGIWSAHGEGLLHCDESMLSLIKEKNLAPIRFVDDTGSITEKYPFNSNGSADGITGICDETGRHLAMMPHPERTFLKWQWAYMPEKWKQELRAAPWMMMTQNAFEWCMKKK